MTKAAAPATMPTRDGSIAGPSPAAREANRYAKRRVKFAGLDISIENEPGTARPPAGDRAHPRAQHLIPYAYGYINGTRGADGEEVDCFLGGAEDAATVYVVSQLKPSGRHDEHKVLLGFRSWEEAKTAYCASYQGDFDTEAAIGPVKQLSIDDFKTWLAGRSTTTKVLPFRPTYSREVRIQFGATVEKELRRTPEGKPVLPMLVSGTKVDAARYTDEKTQLPISGDRVMPELLASMAAQAEGVNLLGDKVYLLENHHATLTMGTAIAAHIEQTADGTQELHVDFLLDEKHPLVPTLIGQMAEGYQPQCSVGLKVRKTVAWDDVVGGWVGHLTEGLFEHVALTRPDHAAYPDAELEDVFLVDDLEAASKELVESTKADIRAVAKADQDPTTIQTLIFDKGKFSVEEAKAWASEHDFAAVGVDETDNSIRIRQQDPDAFDSDSFRTIALTDGVQAAIGHKKSDKSAAGREGDKPMDVKLRDDEGEAKRAAAEAGVTLKGDETMEAAKDADAEDAKKDAEGEGEGEAAKTADAEGEAKKDAAAPPPPAKKKEPAADAEGDGDEEDPTKKKAKGVGFGDIKAHAAKMRDIYAEAKKDGASPEELRELADDMYADAEQLCEMLDQMDSGGDAKAPAAEEAKTADDMAACKTADADAAKTADAEGATKKKEAPAGDVVTKERDRLARTLKTLTGRLESIEKKLERIDAEPATGGPRRYNDADAPDGSKSPIAIFEETLKTLPANLRERAMNELAIGALEQRYRTLMPTLHDPQQGRE